MSKELGGGRIGARSDDEPHSSGWLGDRRGSGRPADEVLLTTKLHTPASRQRLVHRDDLVSSLCEATGRKLLLLDAPAGWGKTTLLTQWVEAAADQLQFAWLSLDPADNDPARFWTYVVAALHRSDPHVVSSRLLELVQAGAKPVRVILSIVLNDIAEANTKMVLIIDDYHLIASTAIHDELAFVLDRLPANLTVAVATRSDPPLPVARLRAAGELLEMRVGDLRFGNDQTAVLMNDVLALKLDVDAVELLCERTEGWAAGLYLAALSLQGRTDVGGFVRAFANGNRHIVDYLSAEVLDRQGPLIRAFLVQTSVLERLSGPLCDAVTMQSQSARILDQLERDNLFVVPLDALRGWYRYHHLFREMLRIELRRDDPQLIASLHRRAAHWFRDEGLPNEAIHHLVAGNDIQGAVELIRQVWALEYNRGRLATVSGWLDDLPAQTVSDRPALGAIRAWFALDHGRVDEARRWIESIAVALDGEDAPDAEIRAELALLKAVVQFKAGDLSRARELVAEALGRGLSNGMLGETAAYCILGASLYWAGDTVEASKALRRAVAIADEVGNALGRRYSLGYLAMMAAEQGRLDDAEALLHQATDDDRDFAGGEHFVDMMVSLATAKLLGRRGDYARANQAVSRAVPLARSGGAILEIANALLAQADILEHLGEVDAARESMRDAGALLQGCDHPKRVKAVLDVTDQAASSPRQDPSEPDGREALTSRELEVLRLLARPLTRRQIGEHLFVSINTVKTHQRALYRKLGVDSRDDAVSRAGELGLS